MMKTKKKQQKKEKKKKKKITNKKIHKLFKHELYTLTNSDKIRKR